MTTLTVYVALVIALVMPSHPGFEQGVKDGLAPALSYTETFFTIEECLVFNQSVVDQLAAGEMGKHFSFKAACQKFTIPERV